MSNSSCLFDPGIVASIYSMIPGVNEEQSSMPVFVNTMLLEHKVMPIHLHIVSVCFHATTAELRSNSRDCMAPKV